MFKLFDYLSIQKQRNRSLFAEAEVISMRCQFVSVCVCVRSVVANSQAQLHNMVIKLMNAKEKWENSEKSISGVDMEKEVAKKNQASKTKSTFTTFNVH